MVTFPLHNFALHVIRFRSNPDMYKEDLTYTWTKHNPGNTAQFQCWKDIIQLRNHFLLWGIAKEEFCS